MFTTNVVPTMTPKRIPRAYTLALQQRPSLRKRFRALRKQVQTNGSISRLTGFCDIVKEGTVSINMPIKGCVKFLESGRYYNIFELLRMATGKTGKELEKCFSRKVTHYNKRKQIERILHFRPDTHYAGLYLGGCGIVRHGYCSVVFKPQRVRLYSTCFAGDTVTSLFSSRAQLVVDQERILSLFGPYQDRARLTALCHQDIVLKPRPDISLQELRRRLHHADAVVEVHIHGPLRREHIHFIKLDPQEADYLWHLSECYGDSDPYYAKSLKCRVVPFFNRLYQLAAQFNISLRTDEG